MYLTKYNVALLTNNFSYILATECSTLRGEKLTNSALLLAKQCGRFNQGYNDVKMQQHSKEVWL